MKNLQQLFMTLVFVLGLVSVQAQPNNGFDCDCPEPTDDDVVCVETEFGTMPFPSACIAECLGLEVVDGDCTMEDWDDELECDFPFIEAGIVSNEEPLMRIQFRNEFGQLFRSELICDADTEQPEDAFFDLLSIEDFSANEEGLPTKRIVFSTKVLLKSDFGNPFGETIILEIENGSIAFPFELE